ncbi:ATP phosphoribosyltransferase [Hanseniaspora uvarum]|nr:ATP phosphoribosyltransferase [Hanseniaspora uvarum]
MELVNHLNDRLLIAIPKKGRLYEKCSKILKDSDIYFKKNPRLDIALGTNLPIAIIFLRAADIPTFVNNGKCILGITGVDEVQECEQNDQISLAMDLNFGNCKLQVQIPENSESIKTVEDLVGKTIVTSFVNLTKQYFMKLENCTDVTQLKTKVLYVGGSVEASCALGVADGIVDLVESGETMRACGLKAIETLLSTSAHLIENEEKIKELSEDLQKLTKVIKSRIQGVLTAQKYVYCNYNAPQVNLPELLKITPGRRAPTISKIDDEGWVAVSAMIERKRKGDIMDDLVNMGASDIMVFEISNCRV